MGFAKYQEDIVSRFVGDAAVKATKKTAAPHNSSGSMKSDWRPSDGPFSNPEWEDSSWKKASFVARNYAR